MIVNHGLRRLAPAAFTVALALAVVACATDYPNTTFSPHSEFARVIDHLWNSLLFWGTLVFILVEAALLYIVVRYRHRAGNPEPKHVHGNTVLEIAWTMIPAIILVFIAVPTVRAIFRTQAKANSESLQVEVIGHQWWWEFRYPQYGVITANELYLQAGRTANFSLRTADVLHSFWIPQLGGKRDLLSNHTNFLWFTPDSTIGANAWNGFCAEYCGASHANMRFRTFTVTAADFESWARHQASPAVMSSFPPPPGPPPAGPPPPRAQPQPGQPLPATTPPGPPPGQPSRGGPSAGPPPSPVTLAQAQGAPTDTGFTFPTERLARHNIPATPIPAGLTFREGLVGDAARGEKTYSSSACIGCHAIKGNPMSAGIIGPNLTHVGSRHTLGAGLFPNDTKHLALWIKNSRKMKPGVLMPTLGKGEYDPIAKTTVTAGGLDDQQIADIVAYLQALK
jgi:cytochrome c oxidase subunit II